ncbi:MAG: hypothetical protein EOO16_12120 [Chitinophagaceae bacterium]|nr:MAG: hypothetical protein EOO16_12120 [Chitinophagaceae bacterium]
MKKVQWLGLASFLAVLTACNSGNDNNANGDSTAVTTTTTTTENSSTGNYAALADSFRVNSEAGNYLDARTGKPIRIKYDATARRAVNAETNEPVWRYVDRRTWWVYGPENDNWRQIGEARMDGSQLKYKSDNDAWVDYDTRWKMDDERWMSDTAYMNGSSDMNTGSGMNMNEKTTGNSDGKPEVDDHGNKIKDNDIKVKASKDGDLKIKDKQTGEKVKYDAQTGKVKSGN